MPPDDTKLPFDLRRPLTRSQIAVWAGRRLRPDDPAGNRVMKIEWRLSLEVDAFARALDDLVAGTDSLRLVFGETDGKPWQTALPYVDPGLEVRDFSGEAEPFEAANRWLDDRSRRILDLTARCFDTALVRLGPDRWIWYLNQHHIATDFVSASLLVARLSDLYDRARSGKTAPAPLFPSFLDYLDRHPEIAARADQPPSRPPGASNSPSPTGRHGRMYGAREEAATVVRHIVPLDGERVASARARGTLFSLIATAFVAYVAAAAGRREVTFGALSHNRYDAAAAEVAGLFVRILPLHVSIEDGWTLADLSAAVRRERRTVFAASRSGGDIAARRYDVALNFVPDTMPDFCGVPSREISPPEVVEASGRDLRLSVRAGEDAASLRLIFDFDRGIAEAAGGADVAANHFLRILDTLIHSPDVALSELSLCGPDDRTAAVEAARSAAAAPPPPFPSVVEAFLAHAADTPDATALSMGDRTMSYAELKEASGRVAAALGRRGIGQGDAVAVLVPRSLNLIVALLGVMRSGAAFSAFEPWTPQERARLVLDDIRACHILTAHDVADSPAFWKRERLDIEDLLAEPKGKTSLPAVRPRSVLYYIHTSGTTGAPKGVGVSHESLARFLHWNHTQILGGRRAVMALATSITFDASLRCLTAFLAGGSIRVVAEGDLVGQTGLTSALEEDVADAVMTTPSQLRLILDRTWNTTRLRTLSVLGESFPRTLARDAARAFGPGVDIVNCYGPTEAVLASTFHRFDPARDAPGAEPSDADSVPIGRPAPDVSVHILDPGMNPVPRGIAGEIYIGGQRLSVGYLNQPELTAEKFVEDPFRPGGRLYRTGDLGRVDPDGNLVHLGRVDEQLKINGVRIEPSEAERAVASHPRVRACVVDKRGDDPGRLVGWYVAEEDIPPGELRAAAGRHVYSGAIPTLFQRIDAIPLSANGKVDRRALPDPDLSPAVGSETVRLPLPDDPVERGIAAIWHRLLGTENVGPNDDFFDLGGDSLAAVHMVQMVESHFRVTFDAGSLEQIATISRMAALVRKASALADTGGEAPTGEEGNDDATVAPGVFRRLRIFMAGWNGETVDPDGLVYRANSAGGRPPLIWCFNHQQEFEQMARQLGPDQPLYAVRSLQGVLPPGADKFRQGTLMAELYATRLGKILPDGPCAVGGNCQAARLAMHVARGLSDAGRTVGLLCLLERAPPLPYPGRVALFFGRESANHNEFKRFARPQIGWRRLYRDVSWDVVPGDHGRFFEEPNIGVLCDRIASRLTEAWDAPPPRLPSAGLDAGFDVAHPIGPLAPGQRCTIEVAVLNRSGVTWRPGQESGISIANRWYPDRDGARAIRLDGTTLLPAALMPGDSCSLPLEIRAPRTAGSWTLQIELCEQGIAWASDAGLDPLRIQVEVVEGVSDAKASPAAAADVVAPTAMAPAAEEDEVKPPLPDDSLLRAAIEAARLGQDDLALPLLDAATERAVAIFRETGHGRLRTGNPEAAVRAFETVLVLHPDDREAAIGLASALHDLGQNRKALRILRRTDDRAFWALRRKLRAKRLVSRIARRVRRALARPDR